LLRPVAIASNESLPSGRRRRQLVGQHVDGGMREVLDAASMIEVEMCQHDVAYILALKPMALT
jgi:hypothetical protein